MFFPTVHHIGDDIFSTDTSIAYLTPITDPIRIRVVRFHDDTVRTWVHGIPGCVIELKDEDFCLS